ncbi:MAG: polysaccharide pyruvyl transferase CsaB [Ruminococcaceae bacterium]|nr:polysaccharide pyruvyl transferase CsaB [Oscillospiraceae bacterium]
MKIFLTTMSMGIGGAETHVFELSLSLLKRGHDVTIVSAGGDFMSKLIEKGIKHIYAPMNVRSIKSIIDSYIILRNAVKSERPDIIHGHARIPALVSHYVAKEFNIPFVTTDHGKFDTSLMTTLMTRWGDKTLTVSEDLKEYLLTNYKIKEENVYLTINGIDTDTFSPYKPKCDSLLEEFGIPKESKVILTVSRLDSTAFRCAEELIECAEKIYSHDNDTRILIIGSGDLYDAIKLNADAVNKKLGINYIIMPGRRTDISDICTIADVFCGVSRAAMEAASSGKSILLAGDGAYFGVLNKDNLSLAESYNFTCRGIKGFDKDRFISDIFHVLDATEDVKNTSSFLREYVINNLSAKRMTDDTENVYHAAMREKGDYDCVLLGYYGFGNMGDDALLQSVISNLRDKLPYLRIAVLSHNVKKMRHKLSALKVDVYNRFNPFCFGKVIKKSDNLIFGGGTLLQDNTSTKSLLYYLFMIKYARNHNSDVILYANGIGPIKKEKNRQRIKKILPYLSLITARDRQSFDYIKELNCDVNMHLTADEALTTSCGEKCDLVRPEIRQKGFICVSVREWKGIKDAEYIKCIQAVSEFCLKKNLAILFVVMESKNDAVLTEKLSRFVKVPVQILHTGEEMSGEQLTSVIAEAKMTVSVRLHSLIFSACANVPMIGLVYDPKVSAFMRLAETPEKYIISIGPDSEIKLTNALEMLHDELLDEKERLAKRMKILSDAAKQNSVITADFLRKDKDENTGH